MIRNANCEKYPFTSADFKRDSEKSVRWPYTKARISWVIMSDVGRSFLSSIIWAAIWKKQYAISHFPKDYFVKIRERVYGNDATGDVPSPAFVVQATPNELIKSPSRNIIYLLIRWFFDIINILSVKYKTGCILKWNKRGMQVPRLHVFFNSV